MTFFLSKTETSDVEIDTEIIDDLSCRENLQLEEFGRDLRKALLQHQCEAILKGLTNV